MYLSVLFVCCVLSAAAFAQAPGVDATFYRAGKGLDGGEIGSCGKPKTNDTNRVSLPTLVSKAGDPICNTKIAIWNMNGNGFKSGPITAEVDDTCGTCQHDNSNNQNSIDLSMAAFGSLTGLPKDNYAKLHNQGVIKVCWDFVGERSTGICDRANVYRGKGGAGGGNRDNSVQRRVAVQERRRSLRRDGEQ